MIDHAGVGAPRKRKEDPPFLTGASCFTDDIALPGQLHGVVVRCPHAHARIRAVDATAALAAPGVRLVLTAADIEGEVVRPIPSFSRTPPFDIRGPDGAMAPEAEQFPLAGETARYAGQPVVFLVAETLAQAEDAAELVRIDYEPQRAAIDIEQALAPEAPLVWDDRPDNVSFEWEGGDRRAVDAAFARASHVTRVEVVNNRIAPVFMEPRSAVAEYDPDASRWTLRVGCQSAHGMRAVLVHMMGIELDRLRVVVPDTGGGFGARGGVYPEYPLLLVAARRLARPVKWTAERREAFASDYQARDHVLRGELALDADGRFTAMRVRVDWRHGAYFTSRNVWVMVHYLPPTLGGPYHIPCGHVAIRGVFSHTTPLAAFRGIGRIEANYLTESLIEAAARETRIDRIELRRRNIVEPGALPWTTPGGAVVTGGAFREHFERALELADWRGFPGAARDEPAPRQAPRLRHRDVRGKRREHADGVRRDPGDGGRPGDGVRRHPGLRHGPRHRVLTDRGGGAGRSLRLCRGDLRGHRPGGPGRRLPRLAIRPDGWRGRGARRAEAGGGGTAARGPSARGGGSRPDLCRRALHGRRHRPRGRALRGRRGGRGERASGWRPRPISSPPATSTPMAAMSAR